MNNKIAQFALLGQKINRQHVHMLLVILALASLVVGVGVPSDGGGAGRAMMGILHHHSP
jgi:TRAP-type uncharacterized transport system fused permease subunit